MKTKKLFTALLGLTLLATVGVANAATEETRALGGFNTVVIYTPTTLSPLGGRSLMIVLHGCVQTHLAFKTANLQPAADEHGMVIAVPQTANPAIYGCWDWWNAAPSRTSKDYQNLITLANAMVADSRYQIDKNQVYIAGLSSGGVFAFNTGCLAPDVFAGMGLVGAASAGHSLNNGVAVVPGGEQLTRQVCEGYAGAYKQHFQTQVTVSVYGTADYTVDQGYGPQNARAMALIYGHSDVSVFANVPKANIKVNSEKTVSLVELPGETHSWPGGEGAYGDYIGNTSINIADYLGEFFNANNRRVTTTVKNPPSVSVTASAAGASILVTGTASDSDGTIASATIELKNTNTGTVQGPVALTVSSGQFSYNGFTNLAAATYEVTVKATDNNGAVGTGTANVQITAVEEFTVTATAGTGGQVAPTSQKVQKGRSVTVTVTPDSGYSIAMVSGCSGTLSGTTYTIAAVNGNCAVSAQFQQNPVDPDPVDPESSSGGATSPVLSGALLLLWLSRRCFFRRRERC